jgi:hypothetical protein
MIDNPDYMDKKAYYIHNNGDAELVTMNGIDMRGMVWVTWDKDNFKNMVPFNRLFLCDTIRRIEDE